MSEEDMILSALRGYLAAHLASPVAGCSLVLMASEVRSVAAALGRAERVEAALVEFMHLGMPEFSEESWYDEEGVEGTTIRVFRWGWEDRFRAALALAREDSDGR